MSHTDKNNATQKQDNNDQNNLRNLPIVRSALKSRNKLY